jgi:putative transposase
MGGYKRRAISGEHRDWLIERCRARAFTLRGLVGELGERGLNVDYRSVWVFVHDEKLSYKKRRWSPASRTGPTSPASEHGG